MSNNHEHNQQLTYSKSNTYSLGMPRTPKDTAALGPLARNVIRLRIAAGFKTQKQLERATGGVLSQGEISKIENGTTKMLQRRKQEALAAALGVTIDALYAETEGPAIDPGFEMFLKSDFADGVTEAEKAELAQTQWAKIDAPPAAWYHVLQALRLVKERRRG